MVKSGCLLPFTIYHSLFTIKKVPGSRRVAVEAGADEPGGERRLKLAADAQQLGAGGRRVFRDERAPVGGNLYGGGRLAQGFGSLAACERLDARRVELPLGDEAVGVEAE